MNRKKILFIISNLQTGGVSKSLTSLMNVIDREKYDISLMVVSPNGAFMSLLPKDLRLITNPIWSCLTDRVKGSLRLISMGCPLLAIGNILRLCVSLFNKAMAGKMIAAMMPPLQEEFDVVVDFNGQQQLYYMVDKIKARKKVTFFHSDYAKWSYYYASDKRYYPKVDKIFTISQKCVESLQKYFPECRDKIGMMENISSKSLIEKLAKERCDEIPENCQTLITIGHVCENKGILWAIDAAEILHRQNIDFEWFFLGSVDNESYYNKLIKEKGVENIIHFLGIKVNPYPYIKKATIVVHPSKFEGRSIALDEAKLLCKPVVVTNFSTVKDQFLDRHNGTICQMNPQSLAISIKELLQDELLRKRYVQHLHSEAHDNIYEIEKLYKIFDD